MPNDGQPTTEPCRFRWNGDDHTDCPRCGGTGIDPKPIGERMTDKSVSQTTQEISLEEAAADLIVRGKVPALLDAAENVVIGWGMGWDMDGLIARLKEVIFSDDTEHDG